MRYLNKIIFLNSAHVPYAEIKLDGNVHFIGTQGVGKSTLLRAILFFYNADKLRLGIPREKTGFDAFYFPFDNSYIVYEVMREHGAYCVVVCKSMKRAAYRFIDGPFHKEWFVNEHNEVITEWPEIRRRIPAEYDISTLVNDYYEFRDIIFGNNKNTELQPFRKYAVVESPNYQNIPRTIQNVFLNSKLDADFIKDTIIKSMNEEDMVIDLNVYRSLISTFEQEYTDVMLWIKPNKSGVVEVRKQADSVIKKYRQLLYEKQQIREARTELNYAEKEAAKQMPVLTEEIKELQEKVDRYVRLLGEEKEKFQKDNEKYTKEGAVYEEKLKTAREKRREYEKIHIDEIIARVKKEEEITAELESNKQALEKLTSLYKDIMSKYEAMMRSLDADLKDYEGTKKEEALQVREQFARDKEALDQHLREQEEAGRERFGSQREQLFAQILELNNEISVLRNQLGTVRTTVHFKTELERSASELEKLRKEEGQLVLNIDKQKLLCDQLRQQATDEVKTLEWNYKEQIAGVRKQREAVDEDIQKLQQLLDRQKGSFCEWLEKNKPGWQQTIGKVIDEETILYSQQLRPALSGSGDESLFGVSLDLSEVVRDLRTPDIIQEEISGLQAQREALTARLDALNQELEEKCEAVRKKVGHQLRDETEQLHLFEARYERIPSAMKQARVEQLDWERKEAEWKQQEAERLNLALGKLETQQRHQNELLDHNKSDLQKHIHQLQKECHHALQAKEKERDAAIARTEAELRTRKQEVEAQREKLRQSQTSELNGQGADTSVINHYQQKIDGLRKEIEFIHQHRHYIFEYEKDKREYFDLEGEFHEKKKAVAQNMADLKDKYEARSEKLKKSKNDASGVLQAKRNELTTLQKDQEALAKFKMDTSLCPPEAMTVEEKPTQKSCGTLVEELKSLIYNNRLDNESFKKVVNAFSSHFTSQNTFSFPTTPVTDADYSNYAANICEFVEENKILTYQTRISERYSNIISRISKEIGELTKNESEIHKTIHAINNDFVERNFTGVIRSIELRAQPSNDKLTQLLMEMKDFNEGNQFNMGEVDLFTQETRTEINEKAVRYLNSFSTILKDQPGRKFLVLSDTFNLQFRIVENDNDTGWIEKIANVGSEGTDILVKAMVNIMLINVFKEKASRKFGDFKLHCMMDEIGKLHPTNVKGILAFANCRNILLINSSPTTYNVEDYRYTYLLSKDARSNTKVVPLLTRKK